MRIVQTTQFKKDINKQKKRGRDVQKLKDVIEILIRSEPLPPKHRDHALTGNWNGWRDCHLGPDWLLIYKISGDELLLGRTGTHSDLF
jgi:mRNA interferase YafQ